MTKNDSRFFAFCLDAQKLKTTIKLTEKNGESSHQRHNRQHNDGKVTSLGSLLGMPVKLSNGIADKTNNQTYTHKGSLGIQTDS